MHAIVIGAGPAGLSAAAALAGISTPEQPITVTVLELRSKPSTIGGAVNLTPLALRYLDYLGVAQKVRDRGIRTNAIDMVSQRTGKSIARLWPDVDNLRVERSSIVESLVARIADLPNVSVRFGAMVTTIEEEPAAEHVRVEFRVGGEGAPAEVLQGDVLIGCDGIHSLVRAKVVDPDRKKEYSGRAAAYGYASTLKPNDAGIRLVGKDTPVVQDTSMISAPSGSCLVSFFEPSRTKLFLAGVVTVPEEEALHLQNWKDSKDGFRLEGDRSAVLSADFSKRFATPKLEGLKETIERATEWFFFPVYMLSSGGVWSKGRTILLGDAAHAVSPRTFNWAPRMTSVLTTPVQMPPQGESTGVAIEDALLLSHVFSLRSSHGVSEMLGIYESLRRKEIDTLYKKSVWQWSQAGTKGWVWYMFMELITWLVIMSFNKRKEDYFARDVTKLPLPV